MNKYCIANIKIHKLHIQTNQSITIWPFTTAQGSRKMWIHTPECGTWNMTQHNSVVRGANIITDQARPQIKR